MSPLLMIPNLTHRLPPMYLHKVLLRTWDIASELRWFAASSFQIYDGYLPEFLDVKAWPKSQTDLLRYCGHIFLKLS